MIPSRTRSALVVLVVVGSMIAAMPGARALQVPQTPGRFAALAIPDPSLEVSTAPMLADDARVPAAARTAWGAFKTLNGPAWDVYLDGRSGAPLLVQGQGIPFIPGSGNALQSARPVTLDSLADALRVFAAKNASLLAADDKELVLNREGSGQITADLWQVEFDRVVSGVPVAGDRFVFYVGHGNLIAFGAPRWIAITTDTNPSIPAVEAQMFLANGMGLQGTEGVELYDRGTLTLVPMAARGTSPESFDGAVGTGYRTALAWRISLRVEGEPGVWTGLVDAHTGELLALYDEAQYAQAKGGIQPLTNDGNCPTGCEQANYPMPWANITIGAASSAASSMGAFTCSPGGSTATTTLAGTYVKVVDTCGAISVATTCDSDLDLKTSAGTDCTVPAGTSAGNTHAARTRSIT